MTRGDLPIKSFPLRHAVNPGIKFSMDFAGWEAATAAGLDMWKWESAGYPAWFMSKVIAWHSLHGQVKLHSQDAVRQASQSRGGYRKRGYRGRR